VNTGFGEFKRFLTKLKTASKITIIINNVAGKLQQNRGVP